MTTSASDVSRVFTARVGKTLAVVIRVPEPTVEEPLANADLSAYRGRIQIRDLRGRRRVLIDTMESPSGTPGALLERLDPGSWRVTLGKRYTSWLPYKCALEMEIENLSDTDDVRPLLVTPLHISPEQASNS